MKKIRIGFQTSRMDYGYGVKLWQGAMITAKQLDADLIIFPGRNLESPHGYDYQYNSVFRFLTRDNIDSLILGTTLICNYVDESAINDFVRNLSGMPIVSIGMKMEGIPSILINNRSGVRELTRHQIDVHGARNIAFIRGPVNNSEANERFEAYRAELEAHGIPFDDKLIGQGDFTPHSVAPAIEKILSSNDQLPDAFMFANDEMAIQGMWLLKEKGLRIPDDTAVIGYDDIRESSSQKIPVTTVAQPLAEMADYAVRTAVDLALGKDVPLETYLPTRAVIRSSCGCMLHSVNDVIKIRKNSVISNVKENICDRILEILDESVFHNYSEAERRRDNVRCVLTRILELSTDRGSGSAGEKELFEFLNSFSRTLRLESEDGLPPEQWQVPLSILADVVNSSFSSSLLFDQFRFLVRACGVLTLDAALVVRGSSQFEYERISEHLQDLEYNMSSIMDVNDLIQTLVRQLQNVGISTFSLSRYDAEWEQKRGEAWKCCPPLRCVAAMYDGIEQEIRSCTDTDQATSFAPLCRPAGDKSRTIAVYPLFFRENHYGIIAYELSLQSGFIYESLTTQISGVLKRIFLYDAKDRAEQGLRQAMRDLEIFNEQLSHLSITDELTGLYNRRGFLKMAEHSLFLARQMKQPSMLVFGDLDKLKMINDTYGHEEGDWAIKAAGEALRKTFRSMDVVARLGGDEFTVFATNMPEELLPKYHSRINDHLEMIRKKNEKKYPLSISLGHVICGADDALTVEEYMQLADESLYEQKKKKHLE